MDVEKLLHALDNDDNEDMIDSTTENIKETIKETIHNLDLEDKDTENIINKLNGYRYVDDMSSLHSGAYLRWICLKKPNDITLSKGALLCDIKFSDVGASLVCKGFRNRHFQINFDECLIYQRLNDQERVLLSALDYLSK
jgi:hypothetical protein